MTRKPQVGHLYDWEKTEIFLVISGGGIEPEYEGQVIEEDAGSYRVFNLTLDTFEEIEYHSANKMKWRFLA